MKKYSITLLTIVLFVVLGLSVFAADTPIKIGLSFSDFTLERWVREAADMTELARKAGAQVIVQ
ncbi:MAG: D-xylose transporter subunit XylF, partial [Bacteroidia bacterium]|nr:D-xylose transporter subunit XylF [Bacteroidia bacterium]